MLHHFWVWRPKQFTHKCCNLKFDHLISQFLLKSNQITLFIRLELLFFFQFFPLLHTGPWTRESHLWSLKVEIAIQVRWFLFSIISSKPCVNHVILICVSLIQTCREKKKLSSHEVLINEQLSWQQLLRMQQAHNKYANATTHTSQLIRQCSIFDHSVTVHVSAAKTTCRWTGRWWQCLRAESPHAESRRPWWPADVCSPPLWEPRCSPGSSHWTA